MKIRSLLFLMIIILFTGCAQKTISPEKLKRISKIGVMSIHGNQIESIERGLTIFGNEDNLTDASSWEIDKFIVDELKKELELRKYTVQPIFLTQNEIIKYDNSDSYKLKQKFLKEIILKYNLDSLLVMVRGYYVPETHDYTRGIAIIKAKALGMENTFAKFNLYLEGSFLEKNEVSDLHSNKIVAFVELENELWINTKESIPSKNLLIIEEIIKKSLSSLINKEIDLIGY